MEKYISNYKIKNPPDKAIIDEWFGHINDLILKEGAVYISGNNLGECPYLLTNEGVGIQLLNPYKLNQESIRLIGGEEAKKKVKIKLELLLERELTETD